MTEHACGLYPAAGRIKAAQGRKLAGGGLEGTRPGARPCLQSSSWAVMLFAMLAAMLRERGQSCMGACRVAGAGRDADCMQKQMECPSNGRGAKARIEGSASRNSYLAAGIRSLPPESQHLLRQISPVGPGPLGRQERW